MIPTWLQFQIGAVFLIARVFFAPSSAETLEYPPMNRNHVGTETNDSSLCSSSTFSVFSSSSVQTSYNSSLDEQECIDIGACEDQCACAWDNHYDSRESCNNNMGLIDYFVVEYCTFAGLSWLAITLMVIWMLFLGYLLLSTTESFLCPAVSRVSSMYKLSQHLTVTFYHFQR